MATASNMKRRRALVIRLSSLGDVVLTTAALSALKNQFEEIHYLTTPAYASFLEGHTGIHRVWTFDKSKGFSGWLGLGKELRLFDWDAVYDLHLSLRTRIAKYFWGLRTLEWIQIKKPYFKRLGLFLFKRIWPKSQYPISYRELFSITAGGTGDEGTKLEHLKKESKSPQAQIGIMPSSRWSGKEPPFGLIKDWLQANALGRTFVVLGAETDNHSKELLIYLRENKIPVTSKIGVSQEELVRTILDCERVIGADTGLIHLAEALGVPVHVWFGPTMPSLGFAPYLEESTYSESSVLCSPCSKDGRHCYRFGNYTCWDKRA